MYAYVYGPVASRRLGRSLGIAPVTDNQCNFGCVYCQLGTITHVSHERKVYAPVDAILNEVNDAISHGVAFDGLSIVGDGEPLLHSELGTLVRKLKALTDKPIALITNGSLLYQDEVLEDIKDVDILLPSLDAYDKASYARINRPHGGLPFEQVLEGLKKAGERFKGHIWLEIMLVDGWNDHDEALDAFKELLGAFRYDRLYLNTPVRPPREARVKKPSTERVKTFSEVLGGIALDYLSDEVYTSADADDYDALVALIKRHPLHRQEIQSFLEARKHDNVEGIIERLEKDKAIRVVEHDHFTMYAPSA